MEMVLFFSSRRRHTRYWRDWSSDVCSADLVVPPPEELFNFPPLLFEGTLFQITRVQIILLFGVLAIIALFFFALRRRSVVPSKPQLIVEMLVGFVREQIAYQMMGHQGERFVPFLTTLFVFVLVMNWFEILPLVNFPPTSRLAVP